MGASKELFGSASDFVIARKNADVRLTIGALLCAVGSLWFVSAGLLSTETPFWVLVVLVALPFLVGARMLVKAAEHVDAIDKFAAEGRAVVKKARRKTVRLALRQQSERSNSIAA